jgi:translation initiation factor 2 subunit 1
MVSKKGVEWPEEGEFVVATVERITNYGAYVSLDEYEKEGLLHISEISSTWVKNIRDFVREKQKAVLKVLRVNPRKGLVDLSLRRVTKQEKREKIQSWKKERKAESLLRNASEKLNIPTEEVYEKAGVPIEKKFGRVYTGLEKAAKEGATVLTGLGIPEDMAVTLEKIARERIKIPLVKITGLLELGCTKPDGAVVIQDTLLGAQNVKKSKGAEVNVYVVSPPSYRLEVLADNYKKAETLLQRAVDTALDILKRGGGRGSFKREK